MRRQATLLVRVALLAALAAPAPPVRAQTPGTPGPLDGVAWCAAARVQGLSSPEAAGKRYGKAGAGFDAGYYAIDLDLTSGDLGRVHGSTRVVGRVTAPALAVLELDFHGAMVVDSVVTASGGRLAVSRAADVLAIDLGQAVAAGDPVDVTVHYQGEPAATGFGSFVSGTRGAGDPYVWTLSEPYGARTWWPGVDHPADKADSVDVLVRVPDPMTVVSNGLLAGTTAHPDGTTTWHWVHRYPISSYLVSFAAGHYLRNDQTYVRPDSLAVRYGSAAFPVTHFEYPGTLMFEGWGDVNGWRHVVDLFPVFEWWYGPYPFEREKYGHAQFTWAGGMEHQTVSSMGGNGLGLVAHELAHQWYGDAVGPRSWPDLWLNEGFATMGELLAWDTLRDRYPGTYEAVFDLYFNRARSAQGTLVLQDTSSVNAMFDGRRVYAKGGMVLHMLRAMTGDAVFREVLHAYASDPALRYGTAATADFRRVAESVSGLDLGAFFRQWVTEGTGYPVYEATWSATPAGAGWDVTVSLSQLQQAPASNVAVFEMPVEVRVSTAAGDRTFSVANRERTQFTVLRVEAEPLDVAVDPERKILRAPVVPTTRVGVEGEELPSSLRLGPVHPNPATERLRVELATGGADVEITLYDVAGRRVRGVRRAATAGGSMVEVSTAGLAPGIYVVRVRAGGETADRTVVVAR